jgi:predicted phosphodiesterase
MKLHIISDLHNEFSKYQIQVKDADVVILAGDIGVGTQGFQYAKSLLLETSSRILFVPGNHEFYGHHIDLMRRELRQLFKEAASDRLFFMDCDEVVIDNVRFLGTTMWTDFRLFGESRRHECLSEARYLNDFRIIKYGNGDVLRPRDSAEFFEHSVSWLTKKLNQPFDGRTVVVTHHLPSFDSVVERYRDDILSACFASNVDHLFGKCDLWVHGHTHDNLDYVKNGTRVVCNPRGYCRYEGDEENYSFDPKLIVEI